jgi:hypothetical protein
MQQLFTRTLLPHHRLANRVETYQVKHRLSQIDANRVYLHRTASHLSTSYISRLPEAADHAINYAILGYQRGSTPIVVQHLSQRIVVGQSDIDQSLVKASDRTAIHFVVLPFSLCILTTLVSSP